MKASGQQHRRSHFVHPLSSLTLPASSVPDCQMRLILGWHFSNTLPVLQRQALPVLGVPSLKWVNMMQAGHRMPSILNRRCLVGHVLNTGQSELWSCASRLHFCLPSHCLCRFCWISFFWTFQVWCQCVHFLLRITVVILFLQPCK